MLWFLLALGLVPEGVLLGADWELWGASEWRRLAYSSWGFYSGLLRDWAPNYAGQPAVIFFSYFLFHAGPVHALGNMAALVWLWHALGGRLSGPAALGVYLLSALGGAVAFGLLNSGHQPMIGASGAVFGLAGLWVAFERERQGDRWALGVSLALVALNSLIWILEAGQLAWESHLGGFVVGAALGLWLSKPGQKRGSDPV